VCKSPPTSSSASLIGSTVCLRAERAVRAERAAKLGKFTIDADANLVRPVPRGAACTRAGALASLFAL